MNWKFWKKPKPILCACDPGRADRTLHQALKGFSDAVDCSFYPGTSPSPRLGDYRIIETIETDENGDSKTNYRLDRYSYSSGGCLFNYIWKNVETYESFEEAVEARKKHNITYERKVVDYHTNK